MSTPAEKAVNEFFKGNTKFGIPSNLPDIALLRALSIQGRLRYARSTGIGNTIFTPQEGETIFIYQYRIQHTSSGTSDFSFINAGIIRDVITLGVSNGIIIPLFDSLVGDGNKTIGITQNDAASESTLYGWSENTSQIRDVTT